MSASTSGLNDLYWMMGMIDSINVGLAVIDDNYTIKVWNRFMENRSGRHPADVIGNNLFDLFDEIPQQWFKRKILPVFKMQTRSFITWEQRPYLFRFNTNRPTTGSSEVMYQNITIIPLPSTDGSVRQIGIIVYDVTETAVGKLELKAANEELQKLSRTDGLTQLNNRAYWEECLQQEFLRVRRTGQIATAIMFDIDHFKKVNDTYGHQAGDEVIRQTSTVLRKAIRATDIAGRYGGEEFGVILIDTCAKDALIFAERLRTQIEAITVVYDNMEIHYTISLGIAETDGSHADYNAWLECADKGLYHSKENGRNRSTIYGQENEMGSAKV